MSNSYTPQRFQILPPVVKNLLIINGIMFLATYVFAKSFGISLEEKLGLYYIGSPLFKPYQFVTHLFMHGSMFHIFSNMFALWMFGNVLENYWGGQRFLIYYLVTGFGAALIHAAVTYYRIHGIEEAAYTFMSSPSLDSFAEFVNYHVPEAYKMQFQSLLGDWSAAPAGAGAYAAQASTWVQQLVQAESSIPTVGASGAVFGLLLAFGMLFPNAIIYLYFALPIKAKYFVILYGLIEVFTGLQNRAGDNVAHFAHLGGMLFGFILIKFWSKKQYH